MNAEEWRTQQRELRERLRGHRRTPDGRRPVLLTVGEVEPPDLLGGPISSARGVSGPLVVAIKRLLLRLLGSSVLEPQTIFNARIVASLAAQREEIATLTQLVEQTSNEQDLPETSIRRDTKQLDYIGFENRFRGSENTIESRQAEYRDYFLNRGEILDIGCGRGEFLTMLQEWGIPARGIDRDEDMAEHCRKQGLAAEHADALEYLDRQPDDSLGGIFLGHLVEQLSTGYLVSLLDAIRRKASHEAVLVIETINPESMPVLTRWFWLDPTHVRLVHPETLQYFMEQAGFAVQTVQFRRPVPDDERLPPLALSSVPADELASYNDAVARVNSRLFAPLDYFVVGLS